MGLKKNKPVDGRLKQFPDSKLTAILDTDWCAYSIASVGDELYIEVTHNGTGKTVEFKNVTEFKGKGKQLGGWLGEQNIKREAKGKPLLSLDDFTIEPKQRRKKEYEYKTIKETEYNKKDYRGWTVIGEPDLDGDIQLRKPITDDEALVRIFYSAKSTIKKALADLGTHKYESYLGKGGKYREDLSTLLKYKGNRDNTLRPLVMKDVVEYLERSFDSTVINHIENDDAVVMRAYGDPNAVVVGEDKDFYGCPVKFFNANRPEEGIIDGDCFGELRREGAKNKIRGHGRLFSYWQMLAGDSSDNYKASCHSDVRYGDVAAYNDLVDCKDDKEALEKMIEVFKRLYPEPKVVKSWRGHEMLIDWLYVAREQFRMATMLRWEGDSRTLDTELAKYNVEYSYEN